MKSLVAMACLVLLVASVGSASARPKRSVVVVGAAPVATAVAAVPVVHSHVVHHNPTTVVKTEQVHSGDHSSYSYSSEVRSQPVVQTHAHVVAAGAHYAAPAHYPAAYYSPYSYVIGK